jgi:hypothetical protein
MRAIIATIRPPVEPSSKAVDAAGHAAGLRSQAGSALRKLIAKRFHALTADDGLRQAAVAMVHAAARRPGLGVDAPQLAAMARRVDVGLFPLQGFGAERDGLLMGFGRVTPGDIDEALGRIAGLLEAAGQPTGKVSRAMQPCGAAGSSSALPPWRSAISRAMARPRPQPSPVVAPRTKRSKARSRSSGARPGPLSSTSSHTSSSARRSRTVIVAPVPA